MDQQVASPPAKRKGVIEQRQESLFVLRLYGMAGDFTANQLRKIADVAEKFGRGQIHLTARQGVEIHFVQKIYVDSAIEHLEAAGIGIGSKGSDVRAVVCCPGNATCKRGVIETKEVARLLNEQFLGQDTPHKFKMSVTGCPNNCVKATENDIGVTGGIEPKWQKSECFNCGACVYACPAGAINIVDDAYTVDREKCTNCGTCVLSCPNAAWTTTKRGYKVWIGGTMGRRPRLATKLPGMASSKEELLTLIGKIIVYYRKKGRKQERLGHMLDRVGTETAVWEITKQA
jgi:anaerobic sulfite reductase subunit C